jgi:hypothetical protein
MIGIIKFYNTAMTMLRAGTTGQINVSDFIGTTNDVQIDVARKLANFYEDNQQVKDALRYLVKPKSATTSSGGVVTFETDYLTMAAVLSANGHIAYPINVNEVSIMADSIIRTPSTSGPLFWFQSNNTLNFLPASAYPVLYNYIKKPTACALTATAVSSEDSDYETLTGAVDMVDWPDEMFYLLLYSVMEKLGFELKDELTISYAKLNISEQQLNTNPV